MAKSSSAIVDTRVNQIYNLILSGANRGDIIQFATDKEWGVTDRAVDLYIQRAREEMAAHAKDYREANQLHDIAINRLNSLYAKSLKIQDYKTALAVQKEMHALFGLYPPTRQEITGANGKPLEQRLVFVWGDEDDNSGHSPD